MDVAETFDALVNARIAYRRRFRTMGATAAFLAFRVNTYRRAFFEEAPFHLSVVIPIETPLDRFLIAATAIGAIFITLIRDGTSPVRGTIPSVRTGFIRRPDETAV